MRGVNLRPMKNHGVQPWCTHISYSPMTAPLLLLVFFHCYIIFDPGVLSAYIIFGVYFHRVTQVYLEQMAEMVTKEHQERRVNRSVSHQWDLCLKAIIGPNLGTYIMFLRTI